MQLPTGGSGLDLFSHCDERNGVAMVYVGGELDVATAPLLGAELDALVESGGFRLVIDLADLTFLDASGLRVLVHTCKLAAEHGGWLRLVRVRPTVRRVLELTRLTHVLPIFTSSSQALREREA
jgi:anti-sigma B factor antagonist